VLTEFAIEITTNFIEVT